MVRGVTIGKQAVMLVLSVVLMTALGRAAYSKDKNDPTPLLEEILRQLATLQTKVDGVQTDVNGLETDVSNLQTDVDNLPAGAGPCEVPPVWGKTDYAMAERFVSVLEGAAFCDKATGLVWDGSPDPASQRNWQTAIEHCTLRTVGDQGGFHLPLIEQLTSLRGLTATELNMTTGDGPFTDVQPASYWSATTHPNGSTHAWIVNFTDGNGDVFDFGKEALVFHAWCVRGGQAYDGQDVLNALPE